MVQARAYGDFLERAGLDVTRWGEAGPPPGRYDVAHLFNIDLSLEAARRLRQGRRCASRVVLSTIHHREAWMAELHALARSGAAGVLARLPLPVYETLRDAWIARRHPSQVRSAAGQLLRGMRRQQREILGAVDLVLPLADGERRSLFDDFGFDGPQATVPNGAALLDGELPHGMPSEYLLCVARVEARKNPLALIDAAERLDVPVVFVGAANTHHRTLVQRFRERVRASSHATWLDRLDRRGVSAAYRGAACHVLPSWCEVVPLVDLEAAAAGARVVTTRRGHTDEYLAERHARFWDPASGVDGLTATIAASLAAPAPEPEVRWTWEATGRALVTAYERL